MKKICWLLVTVLLLTGLYTPVDVYATEAVGSQTGGAREEVIINPLLKDYIDEEAAIAENLQWQEYANSGIGFYSLDAYCDSLEEAAAYVREQMIARVNSISVYVPRSVCSADDHLTVWDMALEHSETGSGQAGDSLAYGWESLSRGYYWSGNYYEFRYNVSYRTTAEQEEQLTEAVNAALESLNLDGKSEYDKIKLIYTYICDHVNYDYTYSKYTPYHALCTGTAVCQGYAMLFYRMCKDAGLSVRIIDGIGNGGSHAWNIVRIGNEYYNLDSTWDGQDEETRSRWFLLNEADFLDHARAEEYATEEFYNAYPMTQNSWVDYSQMTQALNRVNPEYSFGTVGGGTVSTAANCKPRLLVFYGVTSSGSRRILDGFKNMNTAGIDVVAIEVSGSSGTEFSNFVANYSDTDLIFATNAVSGDNRNIMWEYVWFKYSGSISYPVVAFIDADNKVQDVLHSCGISNVKAGIDYYCYGNASPIAFLTQPVSREAEKDENVVFSVKARGNALTYQWQYSTDAGSNWTNINTAGARTTSIIVPATAEKSDWKYRCLVKDGSGNTAYSNVATLEIKGLGAVITTHPQDSNVEEGESATFAVTATGEGLQYQWQFRNSASGDWKDSGMAGSKTASITVKGTLARNGYQYRCVVTDADGKEVISNGATLTVTAVGPEITKHPASQSIVVGENATFAVTATGDGLKYQWQFRNSASGDWKDSGMTGAKTASITVQGTKARNGYQYRCIVTDGSGNKVTSNGATLTVTAVGPEITKHPASQSVAVGANATFAVTATGEGLKYQWQFRKSTSDSWVNSGMTGATTASITVQGTTARNGYQYR
ncbi:MAG: hypothetical protein IKL06_02405, partial [Lachnospiraceae bacterium]|nr:hypothetical protein [Lachnospiraceae bacterium]